MALLVVCLADTLWPIRAGLLVVGFAAGLYMPSAIATITSVIAQPHWGKAIAVHELAPNVAFFAAPFLAELFLRFSTWRMALGFLGAASLCLSLAYLRFGRGGEFPGESPASGAFGALARTSAFWLMIIMFGLGVGSTVGVYAMLPLYLVSERRMDSTWANTVVALSRSYGPILGLVGGWVSDKLGPKRTMVMSLVLTGIFTLWLGPAPTEWLSAIVLLQPVLAVWFFPAGFAALAMITPPNARNLSVGFTVPFGFLIGGGVIPTLIGVMGDAGSFARGFIITGFLILSSGLLALCLKLPAHPVRVK
jgi:NNP family nitrate/nitrite transporter-like MFS transporter